MARGELHSDSIKIEQKPRIKITTPGSKRTIKKQPDEVQAGPDDRDGDVVLVDAEMQARVTKEYKEALAFMEEPVTIRLEPSTDKNSATVFPVWVNGKFAECWMNNGRHVGIEDSGRWVAVGWLPVGIEITVKRKALEVIIRAKVDTVETDVIENPGQDPQNKVKRFTSAVHSFSIIQDKSPLGAAWVREVRRRNY